MSGPKDEECELERLAEDWVTLWQTELAGLLADPAFAALSRSWLTWWQAVAQAGPGERYDAAAAERHVAGASGAPAAAAASEPGGDAGLGSAGDTAPDDGTDRDRLLARIAELESRLAALERRPAGGGADRRPPRRRRPPA